MDFWASQHRLTYQSCATNNRASTVFGLFLDAVKQFGVPSRVRSDEVGENTHICHFMVSYHGPGRGSHIAGSSTTNQRIQRLWWDVCRCVCSTFHELFHYLEAQIQMTMIYLFSIVYFCQLLMPNYMLSVMLGIDILFVLNITGLQERCGLMGCLYQIIGIKLLFEILLMVYLMFLLMNLQLISQPPCQKQRAHSCRSRNIKSSIHNKATGFPGWPGEYKHQPGSNRVPQWSRATTVDDQ